MKTLIELRKIAKERLASIVENMSDEELFGFDIRGSLDDKSRVHREILARIRV